MKEPAKIVFCILSAFFLHMFLAAAQQEFVEPGQPPQTKTQTGATWKEVEKGNLKINIIDAKGQSEVVTEKISIFPQTTTDQPQASEEEDSEVPVGPLVSKKEEDTTTGKSKTQMPDIPLTGKPIESGGSEITGIIPGNYTILIKSKSHLTIEKNITIGPGSNTIEITVPKSPLRIAGKKKITGTPLGQEAIEAFNTALGDWTRTGISPGFYSNFTNGTLPVGTWFPMNAIGINNTDIARGDWVSTMVNFTGDDVYLIGVVDITLRGWNEGELPSTSSPTCADDIPGLSKTGIPGDGWEWLETDILRGAMLPTSNQKPNDPLFNKKGSWKQTYDDQWALKRIGFTQLSDWEKEGSPIIVAVIDTGLDRSHPELQGSLWINEDEVPGNGKDDDKNGFADDIYGWNFLNNSNDITDYNGHGTLVAGVIAASVNNGIGIAGINPHARIMPVKVLDFTGKGGSINLMNGIFYAVNNGARVINISIGGKTLSSAEKEAIDYAHQKGVLVVVASGNGGVDLVDCSPAGLENVIAVSATETNDKVTEFSNWGQAIDIAAPGVDVLSLRAKNTDAILLLTGIKDYIPGSAIVGKDKNYYRASGTSFSAPLVAGAASLILSKNLHLTGRQVRQMILNSADDIYYPGWDQVSGYGRLNAKKALNADPEYYSLIKINRVTFAREEGTVVVQVYGTAVISDFKEAWLEMGFGKKPKKWKRIGKKLKNSITNGLVGKIYAKEFKKEGRYSIRIMAKTEKHGIKESWGKIDIKF